ncbi:hypothetical protein HAX54_003641 [Datura stramonium]|uniref:Uncharacterized protein n=1 Tax=Datura stramonium TaxID=4076 RepID=A0ABS8WSB4_DATST|nr:hypothetical protein [Datura stramonium]
MSLPLLLSETRQKLKQEVLTHKTICMLRHQWAYSCDKTKAELDYHPRSLKKGDEVVPYNYGERSTIVLNSAGNLAIIGV